MERAGGGEGSRFLLLQGTDGLRGRMAGPEVRPPDPVRAFLDEGLLSEPLVECYAFSASGWLLERAGRRGGLARPGALVVAWDPRDPEERFVRAALRGVRKAGGEALAAGVLPTPAAALYMVAVGAAGALVLTASHSPSDQNGVKLFLGGEARKPLPEEDAELSRRALEVRRPELERSPLAGEFRTVASGARGAYRRYLLENHGTSSLAPFRLVLDVSAGAWGGLAAPLLEELGAQEVREVNPQGAGPVNEGGGVVMLEGRGRVAASEEALIRDHVGLASLFEMGRARREELRRGEGWVACGVLDADGDRALCLLYDPFEDASLILAGDELALLVARLLRGRGGLPTPPHFVCTIDSDPGATAAVAALGFEVALTPVGDKWLLRAAERAGERFVLGAEASGHLVLRGRLPTSVHRTAGGGALGPAVGDGLQALVRGLAAVEALLGGLPSEARYRALREPFARSFKRTLYVYYTDRARFFRDSPAWREVRAALEREAERAFGTRYTAHWLDLPDDPDTLFLSLRGGEGTRRASLFVRNSGTEARTGLSLQGPPEEADALAALASPALRLLLSALKEEAHPYAQAERRVLGRLARGPRGPRRIARSSGPPASAGRQEEPALSLRPGGRGLAAEADLSALAGPEVNWPRLRREMLRGGLLAEGEEGLIPTALGRWLIEGKGLG